MKAKGLLSLQEFLDLTKELAGTDPERPICFDGASAPAADGQAPEASSAPAASPAPAPAPAAAGPSVAQAQEDFLRRLAGGGPSEREEAAAEQAAAAETSNDSDDDSDDDEDLVIEVRIDVLQKPRSTYYDI